MPYTPNQLAALRAQLHSIITTQLLHRAFPSALSVQVLTNADNHTIHATITLSPDDFNAIPLPHTPGA